MSLKMLCFPNKNIVTQKANEKLRRNFTLNLLGLITQNHFKLGFLDLCPIDILCQIILCCGSLNHALQNA